MGLTPLKLALIKLSRPELEGLELEAAINGLTDENALSAVSGLNEMATPYGHVFDNFLSELNKLAGTE